jgi:hypothetical protein
MSKVEWSPAQTANRERFALATAYAKAALADPKLRLRYGRRAKKAYKRAWDVAMGDYYAGRNLLSR